MKTALLLAFLLLASQSRALTPAADPDYGFCGKLSVLTQYQDLSTLPVADLQKQNLFAERVLVSKFDKTLYLLSGSRILRKYPVALGMVTGAKEADGDSKTPEGIYLIDKKNPKSDFFLSLHVSYPSDVDLLQALMKGKKPGDGIMIHGFPNNIFKKIYVERVHPTNWTRGCIAVTNPQISEIYQLVQENTLIEICSKDPLQPTFPLTVSP